MGDQIDACNDAWVPDLNRKSGGEVLNVNHIHLLMYDFINHEERSWISYKVFQRSSVEIREMILKNPFSWNRMDDTFV